jgi:hypothetical protein
MRIAHRLALDRHSRSDDAVAEWQRDVLDFDTSRLERSRNPARSLAVVNEYLHDVMVTRERQRLCAGFETNRLDRERRFPAAGSEAPARSEVPS